jgi:hypothetical protein
MPVLDALESLPLQANPKQTFCITSSLKIITRKVEEQVAPAMFLSTAALA